MKYWGELRFEWENQSGYGSQHHEVEAHSLEEARKQLQQMADEIYEANRKHCENWQPPRYKPIQVTSVRPAVEVLRDQEETYKKYSDEERDRHEDDLRRRAARKPMDREQIRKVVVSAYRELLEMDVEKRGDFNLERGILSSLMGGGSPHDWIYFVEKHMEPNGFDEYFGLEESPEYDPEHDAESQSRYNEFMEVANEIEDELLSHLNQALNLFANGVRFFEQAKE